MNLKFHFFYIFMMLTPLLFHVIRSAVTEIFYENMGVEMSFQLTIAGFYMENIGKYTQYGNYEDYSYKN